MSIASALDDTLPDRCTSCAEPVIPCNAADERVWLDAEIHDKPELGMFAYNPATGGAIPLAWHDLHKVPAWQAKGVSIHRLHKLVCQPQPVLQGFDQQPPTTLTPTDGHHPDCTFTPMHEAMSAHGVEPTPYALERGDEIGVYTCHPNCPTLATDRQRAQQATDTYDEATP